MADAVKEKPLSKVMESKLKEAKGQPFEVGNVRIMQRGHQVFIEDADAYRNQGEQEGPTNGSEPT